MPTPEDVPVHAADAQDGDLLVAEPEVSDPDATGTARAAAARDVLVATARRYRAVITRAELGAEVERTTGIATTSAARTWIGDVLGRVAAENVERDEPLLPALCVNASGSVGAGYAATAGAHYGELTEDGDDHAAKERLACYRHFGAGDLPESGGTAALTPRLEASRARARKARKEAMPINTCPTCNMAVPMTGVCDNCG